MTRPDQVETDELPERVEAEAARHDRITLEVAIEEPEVRLDIEFGAQFALVVGAAVGRNMGDAIEHQHRRQWQPAVLGSEQLAVPALDQVLVLVGALAVRQVRFDVFHCSGHTPSGVIWGEARGRRTSIIP